MREITTANTTSGVVPPEGLRPPQGLNAAMEGLAREVLLKAPTDLFTFAADYFEKLVRMREQFTFDGKPTDIAHLVSANLTNKSNTDGIMSVGKVPAAKANDILKMQKNNLSKSNEKYDFPNKRQNDKLKSVSLDNHLISNNGKNTYAVEKRVKLIRIPSYPKSLESEFEKDITRQLIEMESKGKIKNMTPGTESLTEVIQQTRDESRNEETGEKMDNNIIENTDDVKNGLSEVEQEPDQGGQPENEMTDAIKINNDFIKEESVEKVENIRETECDIKSGSDEDVAEIIEENNVIKINDDFIKGESCEKIDNAEESKGDVENAPEDKQVPNESVETRNVETECKVYVEDAMEKDNAETLEDSQEPAKGDDAEYIDDENKVKELEKDDVETLKVSEEISKIVEEKNTVDVGNGLEKKGAESLKELKQIHEEEKEGADSLEELKQIHEEEATDNESKAEVEDELEEDKAETLKDTQELTKSVEAENEVGGLEKDDAKTEKDTQELKRSVEAGNTEINEEIEEEVKESKENEKESDLTTSVEQIEGYNTNDDDVKQGSTETHVKEDEFGDAELIVSGVTEPHEENKSSIINETVALLHEENKANDDNIISDENDSKDEQITKAENFLEEKILTTNVEPFSIDDNLKEITTSFIHHEKLLADNLVQAKYHDEANNAKLSDEEHGSNQDENAFFKAITNAANTLLSSQKISIENQEDVGDTSNKNNTNGKKSGNNSTLLEDITSISNLEKNDVIQIMHASVDNSSDKVYVRGKRSISVQEYDPEIGIGNRSSFTDVTENELHSLDTQKTDTEDDDVFIANEDSLISDEKQKDEALHDDETILINQTLEESAPSALNAENTILDVQSPSIGDDVMPEDVIIEANLQGVNSDISEETIQREHSYQDKSGVVEASSADVITEIEKQTETSINKESDIIPNAFEKHDSVKIEHSKQESEDIAYNTPEPNASLKESENTIHNVAESIQVDQKNIENLKNDLENDTESIEVKAEGDEDQSIKNEINGTNDLIAEMSPKESEHIETETIVTNVVQDQTPNIEEKNISENLDDDKINKSETNETDVKLEEYEKDAANQKEEVIVLIKEEDESKDTIPIIDDAVIITDSIAIESSNHKNENSEIVGFLIEETSDSQNDKSQSVAVESEIVNPKTDSENEQNKSSYFSDGNNMLEKASIMIQKVYRGFRVRKNLPKQLVKEHEPQISAPLSKENDEEIFGEISEHDKDEIVDNPKSLMRTMSYQTAMDNKLYTVSEERNSYSTEEESSTFSSAATKIQAGVRGFLTRKYFRNKTNNSTDTTAPSIGEDSRSFDEVGNSGEPNTDDTVNQMIVATSSILLEQLEHFENLEQDLENKTIPDINLIEAKKESVDFIGRSNQNRKRLRREDAIQIQSPYSSGETPNNIKQVSKASEDEEPIGDLAQSIITEIVSNTYTPVVQIKQNTRSPQLTPLREPLNSRESDDERILTAKIAESGQDETVIGKDVHNQTNDPKDDSKSDNTIEIPELNLHSDDDEEESQATTISPDVGMEEKNIINESVVKEDRVRNALPRYISTDVETLVSKHFKENMEDIKDELEDITSPTSVSGIEAEKEQQKIDVLDSVEPSVEENYIYKSITSAEKVDLDKFSAILHSGEFHDTLVLPTKVERKLSIQKVNTSQESQLLPSGASETMTSPIGVCYEAEGKWGREGDEEEEGGEVPGYSDLVTKHG